MDIYLISRWIVSIIWNNPDMSVKKPQWVYVLAAVYVEFNQMFAVRIFHVCGPNVFAFKPRLKGDVSIARLLYIF